MEYGQCRRDDKVIMAASRLQTELASCSRLECKLSKTPAQKLSERPFRHDEAGNGTALASRGPGAGAKASFGSHSAGCAFLRRVEIEALTCSGGL